jgi:ubiquinone/menaquinone biosynthesis C-methylase UbiE
MSTVQDPYKNLADLYDSFANLDDFRTLYSGWRNSLLAGIRQYGVPVRVLVDLACGTGNTIIPWAEQSDWMLIGVDKSRAMLREARKKSKRVRWICQDLRELRLKERADVVTCHADALNHILKASDIQAVFRNVARILNKGGLFHFDLSTDFWLRWLSAHEKLTRVGPNYCASYHEYDARRRTAIFHMLWFVRSGSTFKKREIRVQEAAYSQAEIRTMLKKAGLRPVKISVNITLEGKPARCLYLARKV